MLPSYQTAVSPVKLLPSHHRPPLSNTQRLSRYRTRHSRHPPRHKNLYGCNGSNNNHFIIITISPRRLSASSRGCDSPIGYLLHRRPRKVTAPGAPIFPANTRSPISLIGAIQRTTPRLSRVEDAHSISNDFMAVCFRDFHSKEDDLNIARILPQFNGPPSVLLPSVCCRFCYCTSTPPPPS